MDRNSSGEKTISKPRINFSLMDQKMVNAAILGNIKTERKPRKNWPKEFKKERNKVIDEAIVIIRSKMRSVPIEWHRGYNSAITTLEIMKNECR